MSIKYKNFYGQIISEQQIANLDEYYKAYYDNNLLLKEEYYYEGVFVRLHYYNTNSESHQDIINNNLNPSSDYSLVIIEKEVVATTLQLRKKYLYDSSGVAVGRTNQLFDPNGDEIGFEFIDTSGVPDYYRTRKYYWDRSVNPNKELLECRFDETTGGLIEIEVNNEHMDYSGQESIVLLNTAADKQTLMDLTGMSQDLADYYMVSAVIPTF